MIQESYCSYKVSMMLRKLGFNEGCQSMYETAIRHNGKDLSFDEEQDLKNAGKADEIKRIKGGWVNGHYNTNQSDWMPKDCCSRPTLAHAMKWLRETKGYHIEPSPLPFGKWKIWVVVLGKPNTQDGKMNATDLDGKQFKSFEDAADAGLTFQLKALLNAEKMILKHAGDAKYFEKLKKDLEKQGFDMSDMKLT